MGSDGSEGFSRRGVRRRTFLGALGGASLVPALAAGAAPAWADGPGTEGGLRWRGPASGGHRLEVTGYAEDGTDPAAVAASARALSRLGVDGINIDATGSEAPLPSEKSLTLLAQARDLGLRADILVGNYSRELEDFDSEALHRLISSPRHRSSLIATLVAAVRQQGWDGVQMDFELIRAEDGPGLLALAGELTDALPAGVGLSMAVTSFTDPQEFVDNGYDLAGLGRVLDRMVLMAYDQHGPTWNGVGPIGGLPWQEEALRLVLRDVPAGKLDLGVAGYGYTWPTTGTGDQVSDAKARQMVAADGRAARWDPVQGEWTTTLRDGTVMWWSAPGRSWAPRRAMAQRHALHGMALWSLALSDPIPSAGRVAHLT